MPILAKSCDTNVVSCIEVNSLEIINEFSLYQIVGFGLSIYFMKNGNNGQ